jgi:hypothetical protein
MKQSNLIFTAHGRAPCAALSGAASRRWRKGRARLGNLGGWLELAAMQFHSTVELLLA